ncbi:Protein-methionine sulfoxide oxidase mical3a [Frankliniella fusca]|uniref:Protein-methionine sulfoxide oxidase mical3a n=1 Tax=Frankliniella fusca TaxID=407009 RepID=A0AAE1LG41_9NEOP|nr:Protein-methionine sulfoxide oxidase mical3a [Frankliniella fusca]
MARAARVRNMARSAARLNPARHQSLEQQHHQQQPQQQQQYRQHQQQQRVHAVCVEDLLRGVSPHLQRTYRIYLGLTVK